MKWKVFELLQRNGKDILWKLIAYIKDDNDDHNNCDDADKYVLCKIRIFNWGRILHGESMQNSNDKIHQ